MKHLAPEELIDAVDGALSPERRGHLDTCEQCRLEAAATRALMLDVRAVDVPDPSPLFWDRLSTNVRLQIADTTPASVSRWFHWPVLAPLTALTLLVVALVFAVAGNSGSLDTVASVAPPVAAVEDAVPPHSTQLDIESQWALLAELVGDLDFEAANEQGIVAPLGAADTAVLQLSAAEQEELARLLRQELGAGG